MFKKMFDLNLDLNSVNVIGSKTITGVRASSVDPNAAVSTSPTNGKITFSDTVLSDLGWAPGNKLVFGALPKAFNFGNGEIEILYPFASTLEEDDKVYGFFAAGSSADFGSKLSDGAGKVHLSSSSTWLALNGTNDGSNNFRVTSIWGFAIITNAAKDAVESIIAITEDNEKEVRENELVYGYLATELQDRTITHPPVTDMDAVMKSAPMVLLEFTSYSDKAVKIRKPKDGEEAKEAEGNDAIADAIADGAIANGADLVNAPDDVAEGVGGEDFDFS